MSNYALTIHPPGQKDPHITVGYFSNVSAQEIRIINECWKAYVIAKVIPGTRGMYLSKQGKHYHFDKPLSPTGSSIIVKGALEKMIYRFRDFSKNSFPPIYAKMSTRMVEPHINVGKYASEWKSLVISPFLLIKGGNGNSSHSQARSKSLSKTVNKEIPPKPPVKKVKKTKTK